MGGGGWGGGEVRFFFSGGDVPLGSRNLYQS